MHETIPNLEREYRLEGWVRGSAVDNTELLTQLNELRRQKEALEQELDTYRVAGQEELAFDEDKLDISGTYISKVGYADTKIPWRVRQSWNDTFSLIAPDLINQHVLEDELMSNLVFRD